MIIITSTIITEIIKVISYRSITTSLLESFASILEHGSISRLPRYSRIIDLMANLLAPVVIAAWTNSRLLVLNLEWILAHALASTKLDVASWRLPDELVLHVVCSWPYLDVVILNLPRHDEVLHSGVE